MTIYKDFNWTLVGKILHPELLHYKDAVEAIADNPYYGFKSDLGVVKSTLYKNIAYCSHQW